MAKLLRGQDRLLLALSLIGDILDLTVGAGSRAYHYRKLGFYFPPGYKSFNLNNTVHRSLKTQNIEKVVNKKGQVCLQLTGLGEKQLQRNFPLLKLQLSGFCSISKKFLYFSSRLLPRYDRILKYS